MFVLYIESSVCIIANYDYSAIVSFDSDGTCILESKVFHVLVISELTSSWNYA